MKSDKMETLPYLPPIPAKIGLLKIVKTGKQDFILRIDKNTEFMIREKDLYRDEDWAGILKRTGPKHPRYIALYGGDPVLQISLLWQGRWNVIWTAANHF
jgi:hypothetical protein